MLDKLSKMKKHMVLVVYCLVFTVLFVTFYSFISGDSGYEVMRRESDAAGASRHGDSSKASLSGGRASRRKSDSESQPDEDDGLVRYLVCCQNQLSGVISCSKKQWV